MRRLHPGDDGGAVLVEVLVAALILVGGLLTTFVALDSSSHLDTTTLRKSVAMSQGEQAIEQMKTYDYADVGMSSFPVQETDGNQPGDTNPTNPNYWVSGSGLRIVANYNDESSPSLPGVPAAGATEGFVSPGSIGADPTSFNVNGVTGEIYRYVTWVNLQCGDPDSCTGPQDAKRLTVAVELDAQPGVGANKPVWLSSVVGAPPAAGS